MKTEFATTWNSSSQPRKQRKYVANAPLHLRHKFVSIHVEKSLRQKLGRRSVSARKGDEVKVMKGKRAGIKAKISAVNLKDCLVYLEGQTRDSGRGKKVIVPFAPSNLLMVSYADDKRRNRKGAKIAKKKPEAKPKIVKAEKKEEKK